MTNIYHSLDVTHSSLCLQEEELADPKERPAASSVSTGDSQPVSTAGEVLYLGEAQE